jgi:hypothetical protein
MADWHRFVYCLATAALLACGPVQASDVTVDAATVARLQARIDGFAGTLPGDEQRVLAGMMRGAAGAPADDPADVIRISGTYAGASGIVVQGGREAMGPKPDDPRAIVVQGGREATGPKADDARAIVVQGGREATGPKPDDARAIVVQGGREAMRPRQDDPRAAVKRKLRSFATGLDRAEAATLDWLVGRADGQPDVGGIPPEEGPGVAEALGIAAPATGPGRDDRSPAPADFKATLRY